MHPIYCIITIPPRNQHARIVAQLAQLPAYIINTLPAHKYYDSVCQKLRPDQIPQVPQHPVAEPKEVIIANAMLLAYRNLGTGVGTPFEFPAMGTCTLHLNYFTE